MNLLLKAPIGLAVAAIQQGFEIRDVFDFVKGLFGCEPDQGRFSLMDQFQRLTVMPVKLA